MKKESPRTAEARGRSGPPEADAMAVVRAMFEAFGRGDVSGILETVHHRSKWTYVGANPTPNRASMSGHDEVRRFFEGILGRLDMEAFEPSEFVVQGDTVVVFGTEHGTVRATGEAFHNEWVQKYVVLDGMIMEMQELNIAIRPPSAPGEESGREGRIDDALRMTFPASDPPAWPGPAALVRLCLPAHRVPRPIPAGG